MNDNLFVARLHSTDTERHTGRSLHPIYLMVYALYRSAIRRERPAFHPAFRPSTNLNHFYPVAERAQALAAGIRDTEYGYI